MQTSDQFPVERYASVEAEILGKDPELRRAIPYYGQIVEERRTDVEDTFCVILPTVEKILAEYGIDNPELASRMTLLGALEERSGFEQGIKFVHQSFSVTTREEEARRRSFAMNAKVAGT